MGLRAAQRRCARGANTEPKGTKKLASVVSGQAKSQRTDESANRTTLLRDANGDGKPKVRTVFLSNLNQPFGMLLVGNPFTWPTPTAF